MQSNDISKDDFIQQRLGPGVLAAALAREAVDPQIAAFRLMLDNAGATMSVVNPFTIGGVQMLVAKGFLPADDVARVLAPVEFPDPPEPEPVIPPDYSGWRVEVLLSVVKGAYIETQVHFICEADAGQSFSESFAHRDDAGLLQLVRTRVLAAKNPPSAVPVGTPLALG